jgi:hypothetical protein
LFATINSAQELPTWTVQVRGSPELDAEALSTRVDAVWLAAEYVSSPESDVPSGDDARVGLLKIDVVSRPPEDVSRASVTLRRSSAEADLLEVPVMVVLSTTEPDTGADAAAGR